ncbi:UDP-glucose 6-dehydrogenase [Wolbachia endosymbiont of Drosophila ananassae]|nr:UDP-glucose 6-dehydrogenase [Wolbachia endosymbiont of Drosophila ananassae]
MELANDGGHGPIPELKEALLLLTEWKEFKNQDFASLKSIMAAPNVFDFRNLLDSELLLRYGYHVYSLGKKSIYKV